MVTEQKQGEIMTLETEDIPNWISEQGWKRWSVLLTLPSLPLPFVDFKFQQNGEKWRGFYVSNPLGKMIQKRCHRQNLSPVLFVPTLEQSDSDASQECLIFWLDFQKKAFNMLTVQQQQKLTGSLSLSSMMNGPSFALMTQSISARTLVLPSDTKV